MADGDDSRAPFFSFASIHLHLAARAMERLTDGVFKREFGLKLAECRVIGITAEHGTASFRRICEEGDFEKSYASRLIATLQLRGLIEKTSSESDQRAVWLRLTGAGHAVHRKFHEAAHEIDQRWLSAVPPLEHASLIRNLERLKVSARRLEDEPRLPEVPA